MRSRSTANAALVGDGSSGRSRRAFAERAACSARFAFSSSSVCSRTRSAATERVRESFASARVCVAISRKANGPALHRFVPGVSLTANLGRCEVAKSLFERFGGKGAITAVVEDFRDRCAADSRINAKFSRTDLARLTSMLIDQVSEATGGPATYSGRDMKTAHADMGVTAGEFSALVEDLVATLNKFGVGKAEQDELLGILGPLKSDIVEVDSTATGTPLPDRYEAAPALSTAKG